MKTFISTTLMMFISLLVWWSGYVIGTRDTKAALPDTSFEEEIKNYELEMNDEFFETFNCDSLAYTLETTKDSPEYYVRLLVAYGEWRASNRAQFNPLKQTIVSRELPKAYHRYVDTDHK